MVAVNMQQLQQLVYRRSAWIIVESTTTWECYIQYVFTTCVLVQWVCKHVLGDIRQQNTGAAMLQQTAL